MSQAWGHYEVAKYHNDVKKTAFPTSIRTSLVNCLSHYATNCIKGFTRAENDARMKKLIIELFPCEESVENLYASKGEQKKLVKKVYAIEDINKKFREGKLTYDEGEQKMMEENGKKEDQKTLKIIERTPFSEMTEENWKNSWPQRQQLLLKDKIPLEIYLSKFLAFNAENSHSLFYIDALNIVEVGFIKWKTFIALHAYQTLVHNETKTQLLKNPNGSKVLDIFKKYLFDPTVEINFTHMLALLLVHFSCFVPQKIKKYAKVVSQETFCYHVSNELEFQEWLLSNDEFSKKRGPKKTEKFTFFMCLKSPNLYSMENVDLKLFVRAGNKINWLFNDLFLGLTRTVLSFFATYSLFPQECEDYFLYFCIQLFDFPTGKTKFSNNLILMNTNYSTLEEKLKQDKKIELLFCNIFKSDQENYQKCMESKKKMEKQKNDETNNKDRENNDKNEEQPALNLSIEFEELTENEQVEAIIKKELNEIQKETREREIDTDKVAVEKYDGHENAGQQEIEYVNEIQDVIDSSPLSPDDLSPSHLSITNSPSLNPTALTQKYPDTSVHPYPQTNNSSVARKEKKNRRRRVSKSKFYNQENVQTSHHPSPAIQINHQNLNQKVLAPPPINLIGNSLNSFKRPYDGKMKRKFNTQNRFNIYNKRQEYNRDNYKW